MSSSPSSTSSNDEHYFSASEYISPAKPANGSEHDTGVDMEDSEFYTPSKESGDGESESECPLTASLHRLQEASREATEFALRYASVDPPPDSQADDPRHAQNPWMDMNGIAEGLDQRRAALLQAWKGARSALEAQQSRGENDEDDDDKYDDEQKDDESETDDKNGKQVLGEELYNIDFTQPVDLNMEATNDAGAAVPKAIAETESNADEGEEKQQEEEEDSSDHMPEDDFREVYMAMMTETFGDALEELQGADNGDANGIDVDVDVLVECLQSGMDFLEPHEKHRTSFFDSLGYDGNGDEDMEHKADDVEKELAVHQLRQRRLGYLIPPNADE